MSDLSRRIAQLSPTKKERLFERLRQLEQARAQSAADQRPSGRLVAYIRRHDGSETDAAQLRTFLRETLAEHLIPQAFVFVEAFPLNPNGKLDAAALPEPSYDLQERTTRGIPKTPAEELMVGIWSDVLGGRAVGTHENFFDLGGHSLLAVQIVARVRDVFHVDMPLRWLFESPTVEALLARLSDRSSAREADAPITHSPRDLPPPLSYEQESLWMTEQVAASGVAYSMPAAIRMRGPLNLPALERAIDEIVRRHEALRTVFGVQGAEPCQVIAPAGPAPLAVTALHELSPEERERAVLTLATEDALAPFDLTKGPLFRARLLRLAEADHVLVTSMHHIVSDGWSLHIFLRELHDLYRAFLHGLPSPLADLPIQYADYAVWQRARLRTAGMQRHVDAALERLAGAPAAIDLPTDRTRPVIQTFSGASLRFSIADSVVTKLHALSRAHGATLFMTCAAVFNALLYRYTHERELIIGTPGGGRHRAETEGLIGYFVNTLVLRTKLADELTFSELIQRTKQTALEAYGDQDVPFPLLVERLRPVRDPSRPPVFQVLFELQNIPPVKLDLDGLTLTTIEPDTGAAKFDLALILREAGQGIEATLEYNTDLFDGATIVRLARHFENLLASCLRSPGTAISELPMLGAEERDQLIEGWNQTATAWDTSSCFHTEFERQVERTPAAIAIVDGDRSLTYAELNERANRLARALRGMRLGDEPIVAILLDRSAEFLVAMLAAFKSGCAYVPLDPALPRPRLDSMLNTAACPVILTSGKYADLAGALAGGERIVHDVAAPLDYDPTNPGFAVHPRSLAYVIFTSGSTGSPKGAMIEHRGMLNHLRSKVADLGITNSDCIAQTSTQSFDVSVWQFLTALLAGGRVSVFRDENAWDPTPLMRQLERDRVTIFETVPTHMNLILAELETGLVGHDLSSLKWAIVNGEALLPELCARWFRLYPRVPMINAYGPTECSDDVCHYKMTEAPRGPWKYVPISGTLPNLRVYVLDGKLAPVPIGVTGEAYIGGVGVGRGYLGDPTKTATSFVPDPFSAEPGARLYRTGDNVRYRADSSIEFIGRQDHQVKIRGFRIEIGEIESALSACDGVRECVVVIRRDLVPEGALIAYVAARQGQGVTGRDLAESVRDRLPPYMVPSAFVICEALPLLSNGKVDRLALPAPAATDFLRGDEYTAPSTPTEIGLAAIWEELLGVSPIGATDGFFELGGHSLIAIRTISRVRSVFGVELNVRVLFERSTIAGVAAAIDERRGKQGALTDGTATSSATTDLRGVLEQAIALARTDDPTRTYYVAPHQLPELYMHELEPTSPFYNVTINDIVLIGDLDLDAFARAFQTLVARHDIFRVRFARVDGKSVQYVDSPFEIDAASLLIDLRHLSAEEAMRASDERAAELSATVFDFEQGPIFRFRLVALPERRFRILFAIHHIVWDETSTMNFARELSECYRAYRRGEEPELRPLAIDYRSYADALERATEAGVFDRQRRYWLSKLLPAPPALDLPTDFPRPAIQTFAGSTVSQWLPVTLSRRVEEVVRREELTLNIFFLAVLSLQIHRLTGQSDFVVGTPIANRDDQMLEPMIGLFATAMPIRSRIPGGATFRELLKMTRETAIDAYDNHHYPSILAIQEVNPEHDLSRNRLFSVMFGVQNNKTMLMNELRFDGLEMEYLRDVTVAEFETSKFDLTVVVDQLGDEVVVHFNYNSDLFKPETAQRMLDQFVALAEQAATDLDRPLEDYALSSKTEIEALQRLDETTASFDKEATIDALFAAQAARSPDGIAVVEGQSEVTYAELDRASNRLARRLVDLGVEAEQRVAVMLEPSIDLVVALLAILKAGGAYVPLDPGGPRERRRQICAQAGVRLILTSGDIGGDLPEQTLVRLDEEAALLAQLSSAPLERRAASRNLAYLIFTSGTTGAPKGIAIEHRGVANLIASTDRAYRLTAEDRVLFLTPVSFDASVLDLFWPLAVGAAVVVPPKGTFGHPIRISEVVREREVTAFQCVPVLLQSIVDEAARHELADMPDLRLVICGGSAMTRELRDRFVAIFPVRLVNHYGPTEVTVDAARFDARGTVDGEIVPIGAPLENARIYVLDPGGRRLPFGVVGELHVASVGLARGYVSDPERTASSFLPDPFTSEPGARMYRTGDLGRLRTDGSIEFVGRVDNQVKVRGNRVELEEIEVRLTSHPSVARCVVRPMGSTSHVDALVAYVELDEASTSVHRTESERARIHTGAQRPELAAAADAVLAKSWPAFFAGDCTLRSYWLRLRQEFGASQFVLTDAVDEVIGVGNAVPISWDGAIESLPVGWDTGLERAFTEAERGVVANTLLALTGSVSPTVDEPGLAMALLQAHKSVARALGYTRLIVPVRPTRPCPDDEGYTQWVIERSDDGELKDPWLRAHEAAGGRVLRVEARSQHIGGTLADWESWTGAAVTSSGTYLLPTSLRPVRIDMASGHGEYDDPCVWVEHPTTGDETQEAPPFAHVDARVLREFMKQVVPDYMIPDHFRFVGKVPLTSSGKIDERALEAAVPGTRRERPRPPHSKMQKTLAEIWAHALQIPSVGINEDFFELGGHSIAAIQMLAKVNVTFDVKITLKDLFAARNILEFEKKLASRLEPVVATVLSASPRPAQYPDSIGQEAAGVASGHHGEVLQGVVEADGRLHRALVTLPCGFMTSDATFVPDRTGRVAVEPAWKVKAARAVELALGWAKRPNWGGRLEIRSKIQVGWGLGSSTADVLAAIRAVAAAAQRPIDPDTLALLAVQAETASDSIMYNDRAVLFAHREGRVIEDLGGALPPMEVLGFNTDARGTGIDTLAHPVPHYSSVEIESFRAALGLLRRAVRYADPSLLGRVATLSSRINQRYLPKPRYAQLEALAADCDAIGVQVAHSGTVAGLIFDGQRAGLPNRVERARRALMRIGIRTTWRFNSIEGQEI